MVSGDHRLNEKAIPVEGSEFDFLDPHLLSGETIFLNTEMQSARRVEEKILKDYKVKPGRIRVVRNMELGAQLVAEVWVWALSGRAIRRTSTIRSR